MHPRQHWRAPWAVGELELHSNSSRQATLPGSDGTFTFLPGPVCFPGVLGERRDYLSNLQLRPLCPGEPWALAVMLPRAGLASG
jgi:hypothetical protein